MPDSTAMKIKLGMLGPKQRSSLAKQAHAGKDIGKKGKNFAKIAAKAQREYPNEPGAGKRVAGAIMYGKVKH